MIFEILSDALNSISPFYMYVSVLWSMVGALQLINMNMESFRRNHHIYVKQTYKFHAHTTLLQEPIVKNMDVKTWLTQKLKRIDSPDDDADAPSFSFLHQIKQIRGGQFWKYSLYSRSLKNIVLSGLA